MTTENEFDMGCVPYKKKGRYFTLTILELAVMSLVFIYLWTINPLIALFIPLFYILTCYFQSYCCVYQDCPYVGQFCPAISGIYPANFLARRLARKGIVKSKKKFERNATLGITMWLIMALFPIYWILQLGILYAVLYFILQVSHFVFFTVFVCPSCALRNSCPAGAIQKRIYKE